MGTSSAHFQEGPKLSPFDLVSPCLLNPSCLALLLGLQGYGKAAGMAEEGRKGGVKLTTKMSVLEITGPLLGRQKPPVAAQCPPFIWCSQHISNTLTLKVSFSLQHSPVKEAGLGLSLTCPSPLFPVGPSRALKLLPPQNHPP